MASVLDVREQPGKQLLQTLRDTVRPRNLLIVLDNCEHLLDACARLVTELLSASAGLRLLATSRQGLGITGEALYRTPSLPVPAIDDLPDPDKSLLPLVMEYEAVQLFVERAQSVRPEFTVTGENVLSVAQLCERLDGIPLAIELAAARVRSLSIGQIVARLDDRFRLLTGGSRSALPRQQTLQALIDWSYDLLSEPEQVLLQRLAVFVGGWTLEAAESVCADEASPLHPSSLALHPLEVLDLLTGLVDRSLVQYEERAGQGRYRLLETVRTYCMNRLQESGTITEVRRRHRDHYSAWAEACNHDLKETEPQQWVSRMEAEHDNLLAALQWCRDTEGEVQSGLSLANTLQPFWWRRGYWGEGRQHYEALLASPEAQEGTPDRADALLGAGTFANDQGDVARARALLEESLLLCENLGVRQRSVSVIGVLGYIAMRQGDYAEANRYYRQALAIAREIGNRTEEAGQHNSLGTIAFYQGRYDEAQTLFEQALSINRDLGNRNLEGTLLGNLGNIAKMRGDLQQARGRYEEALHIHRELGYRDGEAIHLMNLGITAQDRGAYQEARSCFEAALKINRDLGNRSQEGIGLNRLGSVLLDEGDLTAAQVALDQALALNRELDQRREIACSIGYLGQLANAREDYPRACALLNEALNMNRDLSLAAAEAFNLWGLGRATERQGSLTESRCYRVEALRIWQRLGRRRQIASSLETFASLAARFGELERAATLFGAVEAQSASIGIPPVSEAETDAHTLNSMRALLGAAAFRAAWEAGRAMTLEEATDFALSGAPNA